ncbi:3-phenylpropionate/cinnamic acid dioxygenase small subunit [Prauserella sediminis]|uniref:3-phenylpropionate/cinnamic acid dioxygenase small subunit n=1 Tax=Prauserella sediminis TaxID=577680 RepID=A0A839XS94_9PSEU|nr:nuclear transport factor 2 family protein [Prauserella sediminis]MBB3665601.1 3-phenylpropionate/cinnamic acid dioxygenase small subunit [Prauserella sediminis]
MSLTFAEVAEELRAIIAAHAQAQDDGRADDLTALYHPQGSFTVPGVGTYEGTETIRETWKAWAPTRLQRHVITNTVITEWSAEQAKATSDVVMLTHSDAGWAVGIVARYFDTFRNSGAGWKIWRRDEEFFGWTPPTA